MNIKNLKKEIINFLKTLSKSQKQDFSNNIKILASLAKTKNWHIKPKNSDYIYQVKNVEAAPLGTKDQGNIYHTTGGKFHQNDVEKVFFNRNEIPKEKQYLIKNDNNIKNLEKIFRLKYTASSDHQPNSTTFKIKARDDQGNNVGHAYAVKRKGGFSLYNIETHPNHSARKKDIINTIEHHAEEKTGGKRIKT